MFTSNHHDNGPHTNHGPHDSTALRHAVLLAAVGLGCVAGQPCRAQRAWTLGDCIDYATSHNVTIAQQELNVESAEIALQTSRLSRLPDLNASLGQGFGFGRSTDRYGQTVDRTSASTTFSVGTSVPLFTGLRIPNQVKADQYSLRAASADLDAARHDLAIQVATLYLNALYYRGLTDIARRQIALSEEQLRVARALVEAGKQPESEAANAEAALAADRHSLTQADGNARLALLDLRQALNLETSDFAIADPDTTVPPTDVPLPDDVVDIAVDAHPSILAADYRLHVARRQLAVARSYLMPQLSLSASYGNSFYHVYNEQNASMADQLDLNGQEYIGLSLSVPIFNRFSTRNNIRTARLRIQSQEAELLRARQTLHKEIEQAYWNALTSRDNHASAVSAAQAAAVAYRYEADRYAAGKSTLVELSAARTKLLKADQDALQARYDYLMRTKILDFYNGLPLR